MTTLRSLAENLGIQIGSCANAYALDNDHDYAQTIAREFSIITPENALKFRSLCPHQGEYNFEVVDRMVRFAGENNQECRGHVLVWDDQLPKWLVNGRFSRSEIAEIFSNHIRTVVKRYAGVIGVWDVVNEAIDHDGGFKKTFWHDHLGPEYVEIAFHAARDADPNARLFYNDYGAEGTREHEEGVYRLIKDLKKRAVPVDGIGFQMHLSAELYEHQPPPAINTKRFDEMGVQFNITELDVRTKLSNTDVDKINALQARVYADVIKYYLFEKGCSTFIFWGFSDRYSWIPFFYEGEGNATIMTPDLKKKPAYFAVTELLKKRSQQSRITDNLNSII